VTSATSYHHGDLPNALRRAAVEVIDERGLGAFSLREVARRAGVSHTAPAHHFGDVRGLLTSVATEGFDALHRVTAEAVDGVDDVDDPVERLVACGEAYVALARSNPAHCEVMFRVDVVDTDDPDLLAAGLRAYSVLDGTVTSLIETEHLDADVDHAVWLCWATMQGLVAIGPKIDLIARQHGRPDPSNRELIREFVNRFVAGLRSTPA